MADPLRLIGNVGGVGGAGLPPGLRGLPPAGAQAGQSAGPTFAQTLIGKIEEVNQLQSEAAKAAEDYATGDRTDLEGVIQATQKADTAFKLLLALRNKVQAAYEEVKQVRM